MSVGPIVDYISQDAGGAGDATRVVSFYVSSGSVSVGDFVGLAGSGSEGEAGYIALGSGVRQALVGTTEPAIGVALQAGTNASGSIIQVQVGGLCLASVSSSVSVSGQVCPLIGASATAGRAAGVFVASGSADRVAVGQAFETGGNATLTPVFLYNPLGL
jgi:hypothetical protein